MALCNVGNKSLDVTHWVGAVKRDAEGSYMQLQMCVSPSILARRWVIYGNLAADELFWRSFANLVSEVLIGLCQQRIEVETLVCHRQISV